ncbi:hypothetical protein ACIBJE_16715 [Micromonospora sp. NPDC050187]|uniref:hypothetical protein n=1 Tax=Micromonospora sp. NPDC050187 TaxID=3364277 RepID=UPI003795FD9D
MRVRGGKRWLAGAAVGLAVCALGAVLLVRAGLENADRWASVVGVFLNLAGVVVATYSTVQARRLASTPTTPTTPATPPRVGADVDNRISGGRFTGPVVMGRDIQGVVLSPPGVTRSDDAEGPLR